MIYIYDGGSLSVTEEEEKKKKKKKDFYSSSNVNIHEMLIGSREQRHHRHSVVPPQVNLKPWESVSIAPELSSVVRVKDTIHAVAPILARAGQCKGAKACIVVRPVTVDNRTLRRWASSWNCFYSPNRLISSSVQLPQYCLVSCT